MCWVSSGSSSPWRRSMGRDYLPSLLTVCHAIIGWCEGGRCSCGKMCARSTYGVVSLLRSTWEGNFLESPTPCAFGGRFIKIHIAIKVPKVFIDVSDGGDDDADEVQVLYMGARCPYFESGGGCCHECDFALPSSLRFRTPSSFFVPNLPSMSAASHRTLFIHRVQEGQEGKSIGETLLCHPIFKLAVQMSAPRLVSGTSVM